MKDLVCGKCGERFSGWTPERLVGLEFCVPCAADEITRLRAIVAAAAAERSETDE
jgi:hypothetical protein